jgi:hypothetical protein
MGCNENSSCTESESKASSKVGQRGCSIAKSSRTTSWGESPEAAHDTEQFFSKHILLSLPETGSMPSAKCFAECLLSSTRQRGSLPSAALGKVRHSTKIVLPSAGLSAKKCTRQRKSLPRAQLPAKIYTPQKRPHQR